MVDVNGLQIDGATADVMPSEPLDQKFEAFNWNVIRVDGHDYAALAEAFAAAAACKGKPTVLLARTVKGKGVSFMEGDYGWHGKAPNAEQYEKAPGGAVRPRGRTGGEVSMAEKIATRAAYGEALVALAEEYPELVVLDADLSGSTMTKGFAKAHPDRFYNMGIAEANMTAWPPAWPPAAKSPSPTPLPCSPPGGRGSRCATPSPIPG